MGGDVFGGLSREEGSRGCGGKRRGMRNLR